MAGAVSLRVVVADDSAFMRRLLSDALVSRGFEVVGAARNGDEALAVCREQRPDALTLDLAMPGLDGIGVLKAFAETGIRIPVVVVSAFSPAHGARAVDALAAGALDLVAKPATGEPLTTFFDDLAEKVRYAAAARSSQNGAASPRRVVTQARAAASASRPARPRVGSGARRAVVIACSTGGPKALADLVPKLPPRLGDGAVIVQHMPPGFTASLAERLDRASRIGVREASAGDRVEPGTILLAPGGSHLRLAGDHTTRLSDEPEIGGLRPRADLTIKDAALVYGEKLLLVVLTGMGKDGLEGAREVRRRGGRILAEAESTCTVYGMPRAVVEAKLADEVLPLNELPDAIAAEAGAA